MIGPGKYDDLCTYVREKSGAVGAIVIIVEGDKGMGFSVQAPPRVHVQLAGVLRYISDTITLDILKDMEEAK